MLEYQRARHAARRPRAQRPHARRGQAIVEFALVAPVFFALIFGIVEYSLISYSIGSYNFAAKDAARLGSLIGRTSATADQQMIALIQSHTVGLVPAQLTKVEIFKSDEAGDINLNAEDVYDGNGNPIGTPTWPPDDRNDTLADADYLGVRLTYQYTYLTAFVSGSSTGLTLYAISVQRIEPQDYLGAYAAPQHARPARHTALLALRAGAPTAPPGPSGGPSGCGVLLLWVAPAAREEASV